MISNVDSHDPAIKQSEHSEQSNNLAIVIKFWPLIALLTIGLCYLTQAGAKLIGIELPDQANIEIVRRCGLHALDSLRNFVAFAFLCAQVLVLLPAVEEMIFRGLLFKLPLHWLEKRATQKIRPTADGSTWKSMATTPTIATAAVSAALFSAAHYLAQPWPDAAFIALFFFGLAQCWLYRKTDRLWCAILNHALFNLTNLVLLFLLPQA